MDGDQAPRTVELRFSDLPGGDDEIYALLTDSLGQGVPSPDIQPR
jgi:hypothetical protein